MKLNELKGNPKNPRKISDEKLEMLRKSLDAFGDLSGIVFNEVTGHVAGGHQRLKVLPKDAEINITKQYDVPTRNGTIALGHIKIGEELFAYRQVRWDEPTELAANVAANKHGGEFDFQLLPDILLEIDTANIDLDLTGFDDDELKDIMAPVFNEGQCPEDDVPEIKESFVKPGDIWILGNHRLMCGDSTDNAQVEKLMNGTIADICFTSPPYNLGDNAKLRGYNGDGKDSAYINRTDHKTEDEYTHFLKTFTYRCMDVSTRCFINIQLLASNKKVIPEYWNTFKNNLVDLIIWDKEHSQPAAAQNVLNSVFEMIFIFDAQDSPTRSMNGHAFRGTIDNIFRLNPNKGPKCESKKSHGAVFPVAFAEHFISNFSHSAVYEPFCGSGSTLIAAEKLNRPCYAMELEPHYCGVIIERWQKYTGKKAEKLE